MLMGNQRVTHHADTVGVGGRNRRRQQACFPNPFKAGGITIAVQHMAAGEAWLITRRCGAWLDDADTRAYRFAVMDLVQRRVADPHTRYVGDCVVGPRPPQAQGLSLKVSGKPGSACRRCRRALQK